MATAHNRFCQAFLFNLHIIIGGKWIYHSPIILGHQRGTLSCWEKKVSSEDFAQLKGPLTMFSLVAALSRWLRSFLTPSLAISRSTYTFVAWLTQYVWIDKSFLKPSQSSMIPPVSKSILIHETYGYIVTATIVTSRTYSKILKEWKMEDAEVDEWEKVLLDGSDIDLWNLYMSLRGAGCVLLQRVGVDVMWSG